MQIFLVTTQARKNKLVKSEAFTTREAAINHMKAAYNKKNDKLEAIKNDPLMDGEKPLERFVFWDDVHSEYEYISAPDHEESETLLLMKVHEVALKK